MSEPKAYIVYTPMDDVAVGMRESDTINIEGKEVYLKSEVDKVIADLEESHKMEVEQLLMEIVGLKKLVETADKLLKPKGGFTVKDITFNGVKLEGFEKEVDK